MARMAPGIGGSQRLTRLVGKAKAMDMILTGRHMDAAEAERSGLVSRVVPAATLVDEAMAVAKKIASQSQLATMINKEMVNAALETPLSHGLRFERRLFHSLFAFDDQKEGMTAFIEKRKPASEGEQLACCSPEPSSRAAPRYARITSFDLLGYSTPRIPSPTSSAGDAATSRPDTTGAAIGAIAASRSCSDASETGVGPLPSTIGAQLPSSPPSPSLQPSSPGSD